MSEWQTNSLMDIIELISGGTPKTSVASYWNGDIPWLSVKDFNDDNRYVYTTEKHISNEGLEHSSAKMLQQDDIIISARGTVGEVAMIPSPMAFNQSCYGIRGKAGIDQTFLYYLIKNSVRKLKSITHGSVFDTITRDTFSNIYVSIPNLEIQKSIATFLANIDDKIEINESINQNLEQQAQALFSYLFEGNSSIQHATIKDVALNVTDGVHNTVKDDPNGEFLLLSCKNIKGGRLTIGSNERKINQETFDKLRSRTHLAKGDVLISSVGTVGEITLLNTEPANYEFQRSVAIVKPNPQIISSAYLYEALLSQRGELIHAAHGAVQQCLFISDITGFPIGIPDANDLDKFNTLVTPLFDVITTKMSENERLICIRDTLLPRLMSGELDVSTITV